ncbi:NUDIX domain-containing protein [Candidatus Kuenenbacteria bacterium]|nr:NUDIX domain-containing protein [Candidatus Kuenenbacteria bacterium]
MQKGVDYIGVGVGAVIVNPEGKIFLNKRGLKARNGAGKWDFPGGGVRFGERVEDALAREIKEEFDLIIEAVELLNVCNHIIPDEGQHWVSPTFLCRVKSGEAKICELEKCEAIDWLGLEEIENLRLTETTKQDLEAIKEKYPNGLPNLYK